MSCMRSRMRSRLMRPSDRANGAPGHEWLPRPNAMCDCALARSMRNSAGHSNRRGSRLAAPFSNITGVPAAMSTPPTVVGRRARRKSAFTGLSMRSTSSRKFGMRSRFGAQLVLELRVLGEVLQRGGEQPRGRLLAGREQERRGAHDVDDVGRRPVGIGREREVGEHVVAGLAPAVLDVLREPVVEPAERVELHAALLARRRSHRDCRLRPKNLAETVVILLRHAEQVGDHEHRERLRVRADELAAGPSARNSSSCRSARRHMNSSLSFSRFGVISRMRSARSCVCVGRVHRDHVLVHRELVAVAIDDLADRRPRAAPGTWRTDRSPSCTRRTCRRRGRPRSPRRSR